MKKLCLLVIILTLNTFYNYSIDIQDNLFKVTRIRSKRDYFIINATRNDSLFKIISKKVLLVDPFLELLKRGHRYSFVFGDPNIKFPKEHVEPLTGTISDLDIKPTHFFIDGNTKIRFAKRFHYRVYLTMNLKGLYYVP